MFEKILVPLDGSELAEQALTTAVTIARATGSQLLLLRSVFLVNMSMPAFAYEYDWSWPEYSREEVRAEARHYLQAVAQRLHASALSVELIIAEEDAAGAIVDTAVAEDVDLIVMSTHGWSGLKRWVIGSVTERVLQSAPCPVLVARPHGRLDNILITLDGSAVAERALVPGMSLAHQLHAQVTLLRVNDVRPLPPPVSQSPWRQGQPTRDMVAAAHQRAVAYLQRVERQYNGFIGRAVETVVLDGEPVTAILNRVASQRIDLIVMATHGQTGLRRWHYGSVTAKVMRGSDCSLLVVRVPPEALL